MKKSLYLATFLLFFSSSLFANGYMQLLGENFTLCTTALKNIKDDLYEFLPENSTLLSTQPDAFIGRFFPSIPCRFSAGIATSATFIDTEFVADNFKMILDDISFALPEDYFHDFSFSIPQKIFLPTAAVTARIGGIFFPFDVGAFAVTTTDSLIKDISFDDFSMDLSYTCFGGDIRYAILEGGNFFPKISCGMGYIFSHYDFKMSMNKVVYSEEYELGKITSSINMLIESHTVYAQAQISKKFFIFVPYIGAKALVSVFKTDCGWSVNTVNTIKNVYGADSFSGTDRGPFQTQIYSGCGVQFPFIQLGLNTAYNFSNRKFTAAFIANFKL